MKKFLATIALVCSLFLSSEAQWTQLNDFNAGERYLAESFVIGGFAYVVGGLIYDGSQYIAYDELWKYNEPKDSWEIGPKYPGGKTYSGVSFVIEDVAYFGLGANQFGTTTSAFWAFDESTNEWTKKANFPGTTRIHAFSFYSNGKAYVGGGINGNTYLNDFWEYDPDSNTWTQKADYPGGGRVGCAAFSAMDQGYVGLGDDGLYFYNDLFKYDSENDEWISRAIFPGVNKSFNNTLSVGNFGIVIGGEATSSTYTNEMWIYKSHTNTWTKSTAFAGTPKAAGVFFHLNDNFYYGLGLEGQVSDEGNSDFWKIPTGMLSVQPLDLENELFSIYPNPASDMLQVDLGNTFSNALIMLYDSHGMLVYSEEHFQLSELELSLNQARGIYILVISTPLRQEFKRLVIH